jgi:D-inositol-3-phosphate glycosyltransferase
MSRIAIISEHASPIAKPGGVDSGGQNVYVAQIAKHLTLAGNHVDVFCRRESADAPAFVQKDGYRVHHVPAGPALFVPKEDLLPYMDVFAWWMIRHFRDYGSYDIVHANFFMSGLVGCEIKDALGVPLVTTFHALGRVRLRHQGGMDKFPRQRITIEDRIVRESDLLVAECPQDREDLQTLYRANKSKIRVIGCGFDPGEFAPMAKTDARRRTKLPQDLPLIMQIGRIVPRKGLDNVISGLAELVRRYRLPARLVIVGGESDEPDPGKTPELGRLMDLAREVGVADRVLFVGRRGRDVLRHYYSAADVFVTTPWYEPFGITPLEAMACGTPVVGSNVGGIKHTVVDGETGFLVPPNEPALLADRLAMLLKDSNLRDRLSRNAVDRVNRVFTWKRIAGELGQIYRGLVPNRVSFATASAGVPL